MRSLADCPADGASRLGSPNSELRRRAFLASASDDPRCIEKGRALADWLDQSGIAACDAAHRLEQESVDADGDMLALRGALSWRCGEWSAAQQDSAAAIALEPQATLAWDTLGALFEARWRQGAAAALYTRALTIDPDDPAALSGLGGLSADRAERVRLYGQLLQSGPTREIGYDFWRGTLEALSFVIALGDRKVWRLTEANLPAAIPFRPHGDQPGKPSGLLIETKIGALEKVPTLFDSGASGLHLSETVVKNSGFFELSDATLIGGGGSAKHPVKRGVVPHFSIGPIGYDDALATLASGSLHPQGIFRAIAGVDILGGTKLRLARGASSVELESTPDPEAGAGAEPGKFKLDADLSPVESGRLPILRVEGELLVPVVLVGTRTTLRSWFVLDTGASRTYLDLALADRLGGFSPDEGGSARGYGGAIGLLGRISGVVLSLQDHDLTLYQAPVLDLGRQSRLAGIAIGGYLGLDFLLKHGFDLDLAEGSVAIGVEPSGDAASR